MNQGLTNQLQIKKKVFLLLALCGPPLPHVEQLPRLNYQPITLPWRPGIFPLQKRSTGK